MVDLGMIAKVRPCLLLTDYPADDELALISVLPTPQRYAATAGSYQSKNPSSNPERSICNVSVRSSFQLPTILLPNT